MRQSTLILALAASSVSSSIIARTVQAVLSDIATINTNVLSLTTSLNAFTGNIASAAPITTVESKLDDSIKQGTTDAQGTTGVTDSDATQVLDAISSLTPNVVSAVNAFVAKLSDFQTAGLSEVATHLLGQLQTDTDDFAGALVSLAPAASKASASAAQSCIDAAFSSALAGSTATECAGAAATTAPGTSSSGSTASTASTTTGVSGSSTATSATSATSSTASPSATKASGSSSSYSVGGSLVGALAIIVAQLL